MENCVHVSFPVTGNWYFIYIWMLFCHLLNTRFVCCCFLWHFSLTLISLTILSFHSSPDFVHFIMASNVSMVRGDQFYWGGLKKTQKNLFLPFAPPLFIHIYIILHLQCGSCIGSFLPHITHVRTHTQGKYFTLGKRIFVTICYSAYWQWMNFYFFLLNYLILWAVSWTTRLFFSCNILSNHCSDYSLKQLFDFNLNFVYWLIITYQGQ